MVNVDHAEYLTLLLSTGAEKANKPVKGIHVVIADCNPD